MPVLSQETNSPAESHTLPKGAAKWIEVVPHLDPAYGGISAAIPQLGAVLVQAEEIVVELAAFCGREESNALEMPAKLSVTYWTSSRRDWLFHRHIRKAYMALLRRADGVHIHGLWDCSSGVTAYLARVLGKPYIVSAHGMLEPWALANKGLKKKLYALLFERANIEGAACLHALTQSEANDYRRFGSKRPIAVIPNGIAPPKSAHSELFFSDFPMLRGKRIILFLGRIHFKKGLDILVNSWALLESRFPDAILVLAGPDAEDSRTSVERIIVSHGISGRVVFTGMLHQEMKWSALTAAYGFVLPSYSEGFSVAVLEAMAMELPVIVTTNCHLPEVVQTGAGWEVDATISSLHRALESLLLNNEAKNAEMGRKGHALVEDRFTWPAVAAQMAELYRWVQGGPLPIKFAIQEVTP